MHQSDSRGPSRGERRKRWLAGHLCRTLKAAVRRAALPDERTQLARAEFDQIEATEPEEDDVTTKERKNEGMRKESRNSLPRFPSSVPSFFRCLLSLSSSGTGLRLQQRAGRGKALWNAGLSAPAPRRETTGIARLGRSNVGGGKTSISEQRLGSVEGGAEQTHRQRLTGNYPGAAASDDV